MTPPYPARIHVLMARDAPVGVVIRRGPSKRVCTMLWDRSTDEFTLGQWLKGRIYPLRSDLSPDGAHLIYFAMDGKHRGETKGFWTAISRAPYLKALALFAKGDAWYGGGLFTGPGRYWLHDGPSYSCHTLLRDESGLGRDEGGAPPGGSGAECLGVYYARLRRDGWTLVKRIQFHEHKDVNTFEKFAPGGFTLRKLAHAEVDHPPGKGCYWDEHELIHADPALASAYPHWEWAEVDGERIVWAEAGKLFAATPGPDGLGEPALLHDFNDMEFQAIKAPY
jgi:hypothetical protein